MEMTALVWILLPLFIAMGSALLSYYIMQARLEVAVAKERESLAEAQAIIRNQEKLMEEKIRAAEELAARQAFDQLLADFRVEERHFMRESKSMFVNRKSCRSGSFSGTFLSRIGLNTRWWWRRAAT